MGTRERKAKFGLFWNLLGHQAPTATLSKAAKRQTESEM